MDTKIFKSFIRQKIYKTAESGTDILTLILKSAGIFQLKGFGRVLQSFN